MTVDPAPTSDVHGGEDARKGTLTPLGERVGSLCTGIGGLDLAVEAVTGAELAWYAEPAEAPWWVMQQHFPGVPNHGSIVEFDWDRAEPVDILTAGYPCQPFSHAGKRQGADDERHLWPYVYDAIHDLRPRLVVLENVAGHLSLGFDEVLRDLAAAGFDAEWCLLRASDVGAPHRRERVFIVASNADHIGRERSVSPRSRPRSGAQGDSATPSDACGERHGGGEDRGAVGRVDSGDAGAPRERERSWPELGNRGSEALADADQSGREARHVGQGTGDARRLQPLDGGDTDWGVYAPAIARWETRLGRGAPRPTDDAGRLSPRFVEWMMGYPEGWVDGLSRTQVLKALGNAVVPQQGAAAVRLLLDAFSEERAA